MALTKDKIPNGSLAITKRGRYARLFWIGDNLYAVTDAVSLHEVAYLFPNSEEGTLEKHLDRHNIVKILGKHQGWGYANSTWSRLEMYGTDQREIIWENPHYIDYEKQSYHKSIDQYEPWEVCSLVSDMGYYLEGLGDED